jgi:hypothetical protein
MYQYDADPVIAAMDASCNSVNNPNAREVNVPPSLEDLEEM